MDKNLEKTTQLKDRIISISKKNIKKILIFFTLLILLFAISIFYNEKRKAHNILISDKFIKAGLLLSIGEDKKAKEFYSQIILEKDKFYSLLALNTILERKLEDDKKKILEYFLNIEKLDNSKTTSDLIKLKKALYLIEKADEKEGIEILNNLIKKDSNLKSIAEEILAN